MRLTHLLEPAAGVGALLAPLRTRLAKGTMRVTCVDSDGKALAKIHEDLGPSLGSRLRTISGDFLSPRVLKAVISHGRPDCVILNPPFLGRGFPQQRLRGNTLLADLAAPLPLEAHFFAAAADLVRPGGRVLAILPASVVTGDGCEPLRRALLGVGSFQMIHELPPFTFPAVEARVFLVVYDRTKAGSEIRLLNHRLLSPDERSIRLADLATNTRLDFAYYEARESLARITTSWSTLQWTAIREMGELTRGRVTATRKTPAILHTHHFRNGFWRPPPQRSQGREELVTARRTNILFARVHRDALQSVGVLARSCALPLSDCILRLRLKNETAFVPALLAVRVALHPALGLGALLMRGSGARYITAAGLERFHVPFGLSSRFPRLFRVYETAVCERNDQMMRKIEKRIAHHLLRFLPDLN